MTNTASTYRVGLIGAHVNAILVEATSGGDAVRAARAQVPAARATTGVTRVDARPATGKGTAVRR